MKLTTITHIMQLHIVQCWHMWWNRTLYTI